MGTELYENGVAIFDSSANYYCLKRKVIDAYPTRTFSDIDFKMTCSGASVLKVISTLVLVSLSYWYWLKMQLML